MLYEVSEERLEEKLKIFSKIGATSKGGITRLALSSEDIKARKELVSRGKQLGMEVKTDDMGNIYALLPGEKKGVSAISMGSHMDSVLRGGNYDGILGVLSALEVIETVVKEKIKHTHPLMLIDWTNEEGARFDPSMMSSGVITGHLDYEKMLQSKDTKGITFGEELKKSGYQGTSENRLLNDDVATYTELHIEQGPKLEDENKKIGVVQGVMGMVNYEITLTGLKAHAGTYPMEKRKDALLAATQVIYDLNKKLATINPTLVYTIGRFNVDPNIHTIVPGKVTFTLDARHEDPQVINQVVKIIENLPTNFNGVELKYKRLWSRKTVLFDKKLVNGTEKITKDLGLTYKKMYSGAGHDAQYVATVMPANMIFVPSVNGLSHTETEKTKIEDCWNGANVLLNSVLYYDSIL